MDWLMLLIALGAWAVGYKMGGDGERLRRERQDLQGPWHL